MPVLEQVLPPILPALADELPKLRQQNPGQLIGPVARRMAAATTHFSDQFITPMAAVAGSVADEALAALTLAGAREAWVNNGGDIAFAVPPGGIFRVAVCADPETGHNNATLNIRSEMQANGIATSGWKGRSHSLGIADAVTVVAKTAAIADAAATMIANATDLPGDDNIQRMPAQDLSPDSDLGGQLVTTHVPDLNDPACRKALDAGTGYARSLLDRGHIIACLLDVQGRFAVVSDDRTQNLLEPIS